MLNQICIYGYKKNWSDVFSITLLRFYETTNYISILSLTLKRKIYVFIAIYLMKEFSHFMFSLNFQAFVLTFNRGGFKMRRKSL